MAQAYKIDDLVFYYRMQSRPNNGDLPKTLPFSLDVDRTTGRIFQIADPKVSAALSMAYKEGSFITGTMDDHGIGSQYAQDFMNYCLRVLGRTDLTGLSTLDVGCGTGYLAHLFKKHGADAAGIDPGPQSLEGRSRFGVNTVQGYFPSPDLPGPFDCITAFGVLEHIQDMSNFLLSLSECLLPGGAIFLAVPDCEPFLASGDVSILIHEHWSYFTRQTLQATLQQHLPSSSVNVEKGTFGGTLYASLRFPEEGSIKSVAACAGSAGEAMFRQFVKQSQETTVKLDNFLKKIRAQDNTLGFFVPMRAINVLSMLANTTSKRHFAFYDDNTALHGKFFPGFDIPVMSRETLLAEPPDVLLIMSTTFGVKIAEELRKARLGCELYTWAEIVAAPLEADSKQKSSS